MNTPDGSRPGRNDLRLVAQSSLLGLVPPRLRSVSFQIGPHFSSLQARFIFDGSPTEDEKEVCRVALTEIEAAYWSLLESSEEEYLCCPMDQLMQPLEIEVYRRCEEPWTNWPSEEPIQPAQPTRGKAPRG